MEGSAHTLGDVLCSVFTAEAAVPSHFLCTVELMGRRQELKGGVLGRTAGLFVIIGATGENKQNKFIRAGRYHF